MIILQPCTTVMHTLVLPPCIPQMLFTCFSQMNYWPWSGFTSIDLLMCTMLLRPHSGSFIMSSVPFVGAIFPSVEIPDPSFTRSILPFLSIKRSVPALKSWDANPFEFFLEYESHFPFFYFVPYFPSKRPDIFNLVMWQLGSTQTGNSPSDCILNVEIPYKIVGAVSPALRGQTGLCAVCCFPCCL